MEKHVAVLNVVGIGCLRFGADVGQHANELAEAEVGMQLAQLSQRFE
jgi:hypothetical protein